MGLIAENLSIGYPATTVASDIDIALATASLTVLIGANGSGKSTLLRTITGAQPALGGVVELDGIDINDYPTARLARHLSLVLTDRTGGGGLRVSELVGIGRHPYSGFMGRLSEADREIIHRSISLVGLAHKKDEFMASLSDGERQKAMIARALAQDTELIVLDEPTSFLDVAARFEIMGLLSRLAHDEGRTVLLSTHDTGPAFAVADRVWAIFDHHVAQGSLPEMIASGALDKVYPGVVFDPRANDFRQKR